MTHLDAVERIAAKPVFLLAFNGALVVAWLIWGVDVANILISIVTAELVLLGLGANRRSQLGIHAKLDELISTDEKARDELTHLEDADETTIQEKRV